MDQGMNSLLKWGIENSEASKDPNGPPPSAPSGSERRLNSDALAQLMGGPSDADLMKESMAAIRSPDVELDNKLVAFDNFEQLIEQIDNANNMESLGLWTPLVELLADPESELRRMSAACMGTAVQNNVKAQQRLLVLGGIKKLADRAVDEEEKAGVRKKSIYALSSAVRNYQPAMDEAVKCLPKDFTDGPVDGKDMEAVDKVMDKLRSQIS